MRTVITALNLLTSVLLSHVAHGEVEFPGDNGAPVRVKIHCGTTNEVHEEADLESKVRFYLYTRVGSGVDMRQMKIDEPLPDNFQMQKPTKILIHGFINTLKSNMIQNIKDAYLDPERDMYVDVNVIAVDWGDLAGLSLLCYIGPKRNTKPVGRYVGKFIQSLANKSIIDLHNVHVIGHSLGAHVAGIAGQHVLTGKLGRITGLDPAGVLYDDEPESSRLDRTDANFVDVIHTDIQPFGLGYRAPCGHLDFYPYGGALQPKCILHPCSHTRAHEYYTESVKNGSNYRAYKCSSLSDVTGCSEDMFFCSTGCSGCSKDSDNHMGDQAKFVSESLYFSNPEPPARGEWEEWGMWTVIGLSAVVVVCGSVGVGVKLWKRRRGNYDVIP